MGPSASGHVTWAPAPALSTREEQMAGAGEGGLVSG